MGRREEGGKGGMKRGREGEKEGCLLIERVEIDEIWIE